jgi:ATP-dependent Zn protease
MSSQETLFKIHLKKRNLNPENFDIKQIAGMAVDFSGAEVEQAIISALYRASSGKEPICTRHIIEQIESTKPLAVLKCEEMTGLRVWAKERTVPV